MFFVLRITGIFSTMPWDEYQVQTIKWTLWFKVYLTNLRQFISKSWKFCSFVVRDLMHNDLWPEIEAWQMICQGFLDIYLAQQVVFKTRREGAWGKRSGGQDQQHENVSHIIWPKLIQHKFMGITPSRKDLISWNLALLCFSNCSLRKLVSIFFYQRF